MSGGNPLPSPCAGGGKRRGSRGPAPAGGAKAGDYSPPQPLLPKLERRANLDQVGYRLVVYDYGAGFVETLLQLRFPFSARKNGNGRPSRAFSQPQEGEREIRRAKSRLRRLVMAAQLDHMLTLTYRPNQQNIAEAWQDFRKFTRVMRRKLGKWVYVAVIERQKRGAVHFHIGLKGKQNVKLLRQVWRHLVGEGNIHVAYKKGDRAALAGYLAKYLGKSFDDKVRLAGMHRYKRSRGIILPQEEFWLPQESEIEKLLPEIFKEKQSQMRFMLSTPTPGGNLVWACSWK